MASPFQDMGPGATGPGITPKTMGAAGRGGQQNPSYLQARKPMVNRMPSMTQPMITPKPMAPGDTVNPKPTQQPMGGPQMTPQAGPQISPPNPAGNQTPGASPLPPQAGGNSLGDVYKFFASDLANQTKQAKSNAVADASARGVYYGTPLTGSEADIDTQYLRGMGQLQSGMYGNEQQNQLARLGLATNLSFQGSMNAPPNPGPMDFSGLGALFAGNNSGGATPSAGGGERSGPAISPPQGQTNLYGPNPNNPNVKEALRKSAPNGGK